MSNSPQPVGIPLSDHGGDRASLCMVSPTFPPQLCGIGDHAFFLCSEWARELRVQVLTGSCNPVAPQGVEACQVFTLKEPASLCGVVAHVQAKNASWVFLQYDPFSYGARYGINLNLPRLVRRLKRDCPGLKVGLIIHETFMAAGSCKEWLLGEWLRWQLWLTALHADALFTVVGAWAETLQEWFPRKLVRHVPVGSNIPRLSLDRSVVREELGIRKNDFTIGLFGRLGKTIKLEQIQSTLQQLEQKGVATLLLYVGLDAAFLRDALPEVRLRLEGALPAEQVSRRLAAMDVCLLPLSEGITTRKTSLMAALHHGLAVVATQGPTTDLVLRLASNQALLLRDLDDPEGFADAVAQLADDAPRRALLGQSARRLYEEEFSWKRIAGLIRESSYGSASVESNCAKDWPPTIVCADGPTHCSTRLIG